MKIFEIAFIFLAVVSSVTSKKCGKDIGKCSNGQCCSKKGYCGSTSAYCGIGCQSEFGRCDSGKVISTDTKCGKMGSVNYICPNSQCCSQKGYCGTTSAYCGVGCQSEFGRCDSGKVVSTDTKCGRKGSVDYICPNSQCCSQKGYCGTTSAYCGVGCQSEFGRCDSGKAISTDTKCGRKGSVDYICPNSQCCSQKGYCGTTSAYCGVGCQSEFGKCNSVKVTSTDYTCGRKNNVDYICPNSQCCSKYGYCGTTSDYCGTGCQSGFGKCEEPSSSSTSFKLAIIGDSGVTKEAKEVMGLASFNALLYLGDYDYECNPNNYFTDILDVNRKYQFMGVLGNHEGANECGEEVAKQFKANVINEMTSSKNSNVKCEFSSTKYMWSCKYNNMRVIGLNPGIENADSRKDQLAFLKKHLGESKEDWKICSWHFYDMGYHTGKYSDEENGNIVSRDGESFYDYCREQGAIIFSAHDHVYARTHVMSNFKSRIIDEKDKNSDGKNVEIRKGATINILNGVGGWEVYDEQGEQAKYPHWQKKYARGTSAENAKKYGGVFCDFNYGGNSKKAYCQMLRINSESKVFDSFYINRND